MPAAPEDSATLRRPSTYGRCLVLVVALQPFASFLDGNRSQVTQPGRVIAYASAMALLSVGALALAVRWSRGQRDRLAVAVASVVASFLNFSLVFDADPPDTRKLVGVLLMWGLLTALIARLAYLVGGSGEVRLAILIFAVMLLLLPSATYASYRIAGPSLDLVPDPGPLPIPEQRPNVYWLLLDGHARPDVLEDLLGYDAGPFVAELEAQGFQVSSSSLTSYPRTHLSVASTLEMAFVLEPGHDVTDDFDEFAPVVLGNNTTAARFRALGYQVAYGEVGGLEWSACRPDLVDVCLPTNRPSPSTGELEQTLLNRTPLGLLPLPVPYSDPLLFADAMADPDSGIGEPVFAFQHILSPHFPYRYRDDCTARARPLDERWLTEPDRLEEYLTQVRCIDDLVAVATARIVDRDPSAVIIIQSDHGSDHLFAWTDDVEEWTPAQVTERYAAFNAIRLPEACPTDIEGQPLVNTFRIVFACIEGTEPDLLDYRGFAVGRDDVSGLIELTPNRFEEEAGR